MKRADLVQEFRIMSGDLVAPYLWDTPDVERWLAEAEQEAAIRGRLLHESSDPAMCEIAVTTGTSQYPLHPRLYELDHVAFRHAGDTRRYPVKLVSQDYLDQTRPNWRDEEGTPDCAIQGDTSLRLVPRPSAPGTLLLEGYRLPDSSAVEPEIHQAHHRYLLEWVLYRAYLVPDADTIDPNRAQAAERAFTAYFGLRPDSDLRRLSREDNQHHNTAHY